MLPTTKKAAPNVNEVLRPNLQKMNIVLKQLVEQLSSFNLLVSQYAKREGAAEFA